MYSPVYIGLGSNLGNRRKNIMEAVKKINALRLTRVQKVSRIIESRPVGSNKDQPAFLNAAAKIETALSAGILLKKLQRIEEQLGRPNKHMPQEPRTIDLDILFFADKVINKKGLIIPHPRLFEREFVTRPLSELV